MSELHNIRAFLLLLFAVFGLTACYNGQSGDINPPYNAAYRPIYMTVEEARDIKLMPARELKSTGKIYYKDNLLYIGESDLGVHIIDNRDPKTPKNLAFLKIPGCRDVAIKGNMLYAGNLTDLVTIDITDYNNVKVVNRLEKVFPAQNFPLATGIRFECPDASKGVVVGWERIEDVSKAKCYR
jgi:hypothetical protein